MHIIHGNKAKLLKVGKSGVDAKKFSDLYKQSGCVLYMKNDGICRNTRCSLTLPQQAHKCGMTCPNVFSNLNDI